MAGIFAASSLTISKMHTAEIHVAVQSHPGDTTARLSYFSLLRAISGDLVAFRLSDTTVAALCAVHDSPLNQGTRSSLTKRHFDM
jgi:hypothetical protein